MQLNNIENELVESYSNIYSNAEKPTGMFDLKPAIPFVGESYNSTSPKVLSYASAENLSYAFDSQLKPNDSIIHILSGLEQYCRAKYFYKNNKTLFPFVHIEPFNNGSMLLVTRHILSKLGYINEFKNTQYDFINQISVANPGKFSIASTNNQDYASIKAHMELSLGYIKRDLLLLKPQIVIIPKTVFNTISKIESWSSILSFSGLINVKFVQIYQLSFFNNHRVKKIVGDASLPEGYPYIKWLETMECGKLNMESHLSWIDKELYEIADIYG